MINPCTPLICILPKEQKGLLVGRCIASNQREKAAVLIPICNKQACSQGGTCRLSVKNLYFSIGVGVFWGLP